MAISRKKIRSKVRRGNPKSARLSYPKIVGIIEEQWNSKPGKMEWLKMEDAIRGVFALVDNDMVSDQEALNLIGQIIEAFTRRGPVMDEPFLNKRMREIE